MGNYLAQPVTQKSCETGSTAKLEFAAVAMQGWRVGMEDAHICSLNFDGDDKAIFAVFDGHGGKNMADFAEKHFIEELVKCPEYQEKKYKEALERTFLRMDELIMTPEGEKEVENIHAGCTANVVLIVGNKLYCANSGDSRAIICVKDNAKALSLDHKPDEENERKRIQAGGGEVYQGRVNGNLNLSRALGDLEYKVNHKTPSNTNPKDFVITAFPDVTETDITPEVSLLILGCDGIWECRTNQVIVDTFKDRKVSIESQCKDFLDSLLAPSTRGQTTGLDNMTVIVVRIKA